MPFDPGTCIGPYKIGARLGTGGMGEVYRARDTRLDREVAIKALRQDSAGDSSMRRRLLQEARAASALSHPNVVVLHDILSHDESDFLVMEYVAGTPLSRLLDSGPMPLERVIGIGVQMASALAAAHAAGIIHRDVKPANILVTPDNIAKILDFGTPRGCIALRQIRPRSMRTR